MYIILLLFSLFSCHVQFIKMNVFTSVSKLEQLARDEQEMLASLEIYIRDSETGGIEVPENVKRFYNDLLDTSVRTIQEHFMENPINAFHFIHRMHVTWPTVITTIDCEQCTLTTPLIDFKARLSGIEEQSDIQVTSEDLQWSAMAVVRLWQTYKLHLPSLFRGHILNASTNPLSFEDILYICNQLDFRNDFYKEIVWLKALLKEMTNNKLYNDKEVTRVIKQMAGAYSKYGMPWESVDLLEKLITTANANDHAKLKRDLAFYRTKIKDDSEREIELKPSEVDLAKLHYEALCRGHVTRKRKILSRLRCIHRKTSVPIYRVKEEILNYDPRVSLFHQLRTSSIVGDGPRQSLKEFNYRVSQTAWLPDHSSDLVKSVSNRIELITGLSTQQFRSFSHAEDLQVLNYGVGGMYEAHLDCLNALIHINPVRAEDTVFLRGTGDRVSTWMFYLNDVQAGGATVFLDLNITVPVEKGAAVFWYNIRRNGEIDERTRHAGCPVLIGSKWVANKWIRQHGQIFRRKCGKNINSIDTRL
ncbi:prolyl 4-hydroxylase subunit alpha-2-like isoform X2 [Mercenaria mercenaria]|uniref:prolyl 4-hydroxylase subunit alpha-2-like isoform X2 n=1 Tax=Mercenaria mercenaria TaxID=6596 RepID=UPI00234E593D|nr:prolyl 4-hydroxylase subunit alpha-2-like isoform X2 [Mercenaria mercenaria]